MSRVANFYDNLYLIHWFQNNVKTTPLTAKDVQYYRGGVQVGGRARVVAGVFSSGIVYYQVSDL